MESRADLLAKVVRYELPLEETLVMLRAYGWDSDKELLILSGPDVLSIIDRFLTGDITARQLQHWAELLEMRDDLGYDEDRADLLRRIIFRLANPEANGTITRGLVSEIRALVIEAR